MRVGVITDSLGDLRIGVTDLRLVAGASSADATIVTNHHNSIMDMYFFDVSGLLSGEEIQIWGANSNTAGAGINRATIGAVMFDSAENVIPEPSTFLIWTLGLLGLGWFGRRRKRTA